MSWVTAQTCWQSLTHPTHSTRPCELPTFVLQPSCQASEHLPGERCKGEGSVVAGHFSITLAHHCDASEEWVVLSFLDDPCCNEVLSQLWLLAFPLTQQYRSNETFSLLSLWWSHNHALQVGQLLFFKQKTLYPWTLPPTQIGFTQN